MIPNMPILTEKITERQYPNRTYKINIDSTAKELALTFEPDSFATVGVGIIGKLVLGRTEVLDRISGYIDDLESVKQAIYLILNTERYKFSIYSWDYGIELVDLFGKPMPYVMSELPRRIKEALTQDNRISDVTDFEFEQNGKKLRTKFTVITNVGNISTDLEVEV